MGLSSAQDAERQGTTGGGTGPSQGGSRRCQGRQSGERFSREAGEGVPGVPNAAAARGPLPPRRQHPRGAAHGNHVRRLTPIGQGGTRECRCRVAAVCRTGVGHERRSEASAGGTGPQGLHPPDGRDHWCPEWAARPERDIAHRASSTACGQRHQGLLYGSHWCLLRDEGRLGGVPHEPRDRFRPDQERHDGRT